MHNWNKVINNNKNNNLSNILNVKNQTEKIEKEIKEKEKIIKYGGGSVNLPEQCKLLSQMKVDALKGKLAILEGLSK